MKRAEGSRHTGGAGIAGLTFLPHFPGIHNRMPDEVKDFIDTYYDEV